MLSAEILHWLTVDEIRDGIFDILIGSVSRLRVLFAKLFVPVIVGFGLAFLSLLLNNLLAKYYSFTYWMFSLNSICFLLFAAVLFALMEFITLLMMRKNNTNIHFFMLLFGAAFMSGAYSLIINGAIWIFYILLILLPFLFANLCIVLLKSRHQVLLRRASYPFLKLYGERNISMWDAYFRKNISAIRLHNHALWHVAIACAMPILAAVFTASQMLFPKEWALIIALSVIPGTVNTYLIFYSSLYENRNKLQELFQVKGISLRQRVLEKAVSAAVLSWVFCTLSFLVIRFVSAYRFVILFATMGSSLFSAMICAVCFCKVRSFKGENMVKVLISLISISLQLPLLLL